MIQGLDYNGVTDCLLTPVEVQTERNISNGQSLVLTTGHPYWTAEIRVETPTRQSKAVWRSWVTARQASRKPFLLSRSFSLVPRGGAVNDTGLEIASIDKAASTVSLTGAGAWTARPGDMLSYKTNAGGYWLGEVTEAAVAVAGAITVPVWPFPATPHASDARPRRMFAFGEFYLTGRLGRSETADPDYLEFSARQLVRVAGDAASPIAHPVQGANLPVVEVLAL